MKVRETFMRCKKEKYDDFSLLFGREKYALNSVEFGLIEPIRAENRGRWRRLIVESN